MRREPAAFTIAATASLRDAATCIDRNRTGIALVVDADGRLVETVTDGDIRRAILGGLSLDVSLSALPSRAARSANQKPVTGQIGEDEASLRRRMAERAVRQLPLLDDEARVVDMLVVDDFVTPAPLDVRAVVMAGGFGTRLGALTQTTPKPMLPVGDRPLLEHIVGQLRDAGINRVNVTTHYLGDVIKKHFDDGARFGVDMSYTEEAVPLGTAGALSLLDSAVDEPLLVMNGDILTSIDVRGMLRFHREQGAELTVAIRQFDMTVPFGVVESDGARVTGIREKPKQSFLVNAGIYLLEPAVLRGLERGARLDMPQLIEKLISAGRHVASFPIVEYWLDVGRPDDYARAQVDVDNVRE